MPPLVGGRGGVGARHTRAVSTKAQLRAAVRAARRRRALETAERVAAGQALAQHAVALAGAAASPTADGADIAAVCRVAAYRSTRTEPPTEALRAALRAAGYQVLLPVVVGDRRLHWRLDTDEQGQTHWGADGLAFCDLVLTPGLAVDRSGLRLGQGGGYYDAALAHVRPGVPVVTVLFDDELVDDPLPAEPHDRRVGGVLTPGRGLVPLPVPLPSGQPPPGPAAAG